MNNNLAPTYKKMFGYYWVLWYASSNSYSIIESSYKTLLDTYLLSDTIDAFKTKVHIDDNVSNPNTIAKNISNYLKDCNNPLTPTIDKHEIVDTSKRRISKYYTIKGKTIQIYFDSELVLKTIHPTLAHLSTGPRDSVYTAFDIYLKDQQLYLFKDERLISCVPKKEYHLIQGKFIMQLLCTIHEKEEADWIGTFHGSTITNGESSILFVGESGKGKSTLCTLLCANGFDLLADDVSPMLSKDKNIYHNPSAISIKEGAFNVLRPIVNNFDNLPIVKFNKTKGPLKYMPCSNPSNNHYPCHAIILVNYKRKSDTILESVTIKTLLETLIPDSWLSPNPLNAKQFLDWLETVGIYKLTYSDTQSVTLGITELFQQLDKNL